MQPCELVLNSAHSGKVFFRSVWHTNAVTSVRDQQAEYSVLASANTTGIGLVLVSPILAMITPPIWACMSVLCNKSTALCSMYTLHRQIKRHSWRIMKRRLAKHHSPPGCQTALQTAAMPDHTCHSSMPTTDQYQVTHLTPACVNSVKALKVLYGCSIYIIIQSWLTQLFAISSEMAWCMTAKFCTDTCHLCVTHGLGLISIGVINTIYFRPIQHLFHLTEGKQNTKLAEYVIPYTVPSANIFTIQHVYGRRQITFSAGSARKAPDRWSAQLDRHSSRNVAMLRFGLYNICSVLVGRYTHTHTQPFYCWSGICPGPPGSAGTRKVKPIWIYWSKR